MDLGRGFEAERCLNCGHREDMVILANRGNRLCILSKSAQSVGQKDSPVTHVMEM
jgi:hypothetical protein